MVIYPPADGIKCTRENRIVWERYKVDDATLGSSRGQLHVHLTSPYTAQLVTPGSSDKII